MSELVKIVGDIKPRRSAAEVFALESLPFLDVSHFELITTRTEDLGENRYRTTIEYKLKPDEDFSWADDCIRISLWDKDIGSALERIAERLPHKFDTKSAQDYLEIMLQYQEPDNSHYAHFLIEQTNLSGGEIYLRCYFKPIKAKKRLRRGTRKGSRYGLSPAKWDKMRDINDRQLNGEEIPQKDIDFVMRYAGPTTRLGKEFSIGCYGNRGFMGCDDWGGIQEIKWYNGIGKHFPDPFIMDGEAPLGVPKRVRDRFRPKD